KGHISRDCPNRTGQVNNRINVEQNSQQRDPEIREADVLLFKVTEQTVPKKYEYFRI
ncbi:17148_t:CDS:1, partial [Racocetra fulgida]